MAIFNSYVSLPEGNLRLPGLQFWHSHSDLSSRPCLGEESLFRRQSKMTSALGSGCISHRHQDRSMVRFSCGKPKKMNHAAYYHKWVVFKSSPNGKFMVVQSPKTTCGPCAAVTQTISHEPWKKHIPIKPSGITHFHHLH
jgi:hypothetical protein